jgi:hypothetical protein
MLITFSANAEASFESVHSKWTQGLLSSVRLANSLYQSAECKLTQVWRPDLVTGSSSKQNRRLCSGLAVSVGVNSIVEWPQQETRGQDGDNCGENGSHGVGRR